MRNNREIIEDLERRITTRMSANIVSDLLKVGISLGEMAQAMKVSPNFLRRVQKKLHSFTYDDIKRLATLTNQTPQLLYFNSVRPVPAEVKELFDSTRQALEVCASDASTLQRKRARRARSKASKAA